MGRSSFRPNTTLIPMSETTQDVSLLKKKKKKKKKKIASFEKMLSFDVFILILVK